MSASRITIPLDIPDVRVLDGPVSREGEYVLTIERTLKSARCHPWGQLMRKFHASDEWVTVRHRPILGHRTDVRFRPKRFACEACDGKPTTTQPLSWPVPNRPHTQAYAMHRRLPWVNATMAAVSLQACLADDGGSGLMDRWLATPVDWTAYTALGVLGFDAMALQKGHRDDGVIGTAR